MSNKNYGVDGVENLTYDSGSTDNLSHNPQHHPYSEISYPTNATSTFIDNGPAKPPRPRPTTLTVPLNDINQRPGVGRPVSAPSAPIINRPSTITNNGYADDKTRQSTYSDYSEISDVMPARFGGVGGDRHSDLYNEIPMRRTDTDASIASSTVTRRNQLYGSTQEVQPPKVTRKTKETAEKEGGSERFCLCVFLLFIGLVAVGALVLVFLVMFGIVAIQKGMDEEPSTGASTSSQTLGKINELNKQLIQLQANLSRMAQTESLVTVLNQQIMKQNLVIEELRGNLTKSEVIIQMLNSSMTTLSMRQGPQGPQGDVGPPGPPGTSAIFNSSLCKFETESSIGISTEVQAFPQHYQDEYLTNLSCTFANIDQNHPDKAVTSVILEEFTRRDNVKSYKCICKGAGIAYALECRIHYWHCPI